jgi:hypothetical protein
MVATYQIKPSEMTADWVQSLKDAFGDQCLEIRVKHAPEWRTSNGFLVREGMVVPKGDEDTRYYCAENLRHIKETGESLPEYRGTGEQNKVVSGAEWGAFVQAVEELP